VKPLLSLLLLLGLSPLFSQAADKSPDAAMLAGFEKELAALDKVVADGGGTVSQYSRRGDLHVFLVKFEEAVKDYEKVNELDPTQEGKNWRLGIAYYLAGDFDKSIATFEKYYQGDKEDRETGLWHFMAVAGKTSVAEAQIKMLKYNTEAKAPFNTLYDLFQGKYETQEFFRDLYDRNLSAKQDVMFYARLYAGIFEEVNERPETAAKFIKMAYDSQWGRKASDGPGYMWQIARILATAKEEAPAEGEKKTEEKK